jgi:molecular chaperone GrpE (heat shock protein)
LSCFIQPFLFQPQAMDLTQEEKDELKNYPNGSKFMLLYEEELARVKELQAQILTFDANLERVQTIADNWKKEQDRTLEQDLQPIEVRLFFEPFLRFIFDFKRFFRHLLLI